MIGYRNPRCWAAAFAGVALAGMFDVIDQASMTTLLIVLAVTGWRAVTGRGSCVLGQRA